MTNKHICPGEIPDGLLQQAAVRAVFENEGKIQLRVCMVHMVIKGLVQDLEKPGSNLHSANRILLSDFGSDI